MKSRIALLPAVLSLSIAVAASFTTTVQANGQLLPDEIINRFVKPQAAAGELDQVEVMQRELETLQRTLNGSFQRSDLSAHQTKLSLLRQSLMQEWKKTHNRLKISGDARQLAAWEALRDKLNARFDALNAELTATSDALAKQGRVGATEVAKRTARQIDGFLIEQAQQAQFPAPNFVSTEAILQAPSKKAAPLPAYLVAPSTKKMPKGDARPAHAVASAFSAPTLPAEAAVCSYNSEDLGQDASPQLDASISAEIRGLAAKLDYSPAKIYQYVAEKIRFEPYYGSLKGAQGTLVSLSGNATDHASLLIALLRASNIPSRYVKGTVQFGNDTRAQEWLGTKSYVASARMLGQGGVPAGSGTNVVQFTHVWVEACVPYANYRGRSADATGYRWIPLDASFKTKEYQAGIATSVSFDYTSYLSTRTFDSPTEKYEQQVSSYIKTRAPYYGNNTLADVGYIGRQKPVQLDVLPASLPYDVINFTGWGSGLTAEVAKLPEPHRAKLHLTLKNGAGTALASTLVLPMVDVATKRLTLSFKGATGADQTTLDAWRNDGNPDSSTPCTVNVVPSVKLEATEKLAGTGTAVGLCSADNKLEMDLQLAEIANPRVNYVPFNSIKAANYHALQAYAFNASDRLIAERTAKLLASVKANSNPNANPEELEGEFLHVAGMKYMRYISDAAKRVGELDGGTGESGNHLGLTATQMKVQYLFDLPFAVYRSGFYIDVPGGQLRSINLSSGDLVWKTFKLAGYNSSFFESYIWQETARMDAVSTVRGLQYAKEIGIPILTVNSANWGAMSSQFTSNANPALNYSPTHVTNIKSQFIDNGYTLSIPRSLIQYGTWTGAVFVAEKDQTPTSAQASYIINQYAGGYTTGAPAPIAWNSSTGTGYQAETQQPTGLPSWLERPTNSTTAANGYNPLAIFSGDPVNMVTGNMYHAETDISLKGRGGLPIVFARSYNSRAPADGPLGFGWTHSFNHSLRFYGVDGGAVKASWIDGSGGERFFSLAGSTVPNGSSFSSPRGIYAVLKRESDGTYSITEKNGLTYKFESNAGTTAGQSSNLVSIRDRNNNALSLSYVSSKLAAVTDGLGRALTFTYNAAGRLQEVSDWAGRKFQYGYDTNGNLTTFKNPLAVAGTLPPITYAYYGTADGAQLNHAMKRFAAPKGNGMTFEYYANGRVSRHCNDAGGCMSFTYNDFRRESVSVDERGHSKRHFFDSYGNPSKVVDENGNQQTFTYDSTNPMQRLSERDELGYTKQYLYDAKGNITRITQPSGNTVEFSYFSAFNAPGKVKDPRGNYALYKYDAKGNLQHELALKAGIGASIDPTAYTPAPTDLVAWTIHSYDSYGNRVSSKRVRDFATQVGPVVTYDLNDTVNAVAGLNVVKITRQGDKNGDGTVDAAESVNLVSDNLGRTTQGADDSWYQTGIQYDANGRVIRATDATGNWRDFGYDSNGNAVSESLTASPAGVPTLLHQTSAIYDKLDRAVSKTDAGGFTSQFVYDERGNVKLVTSPDGYTIGFDYDARGSVIRAFDKEGHFVARRLDAIGRTREVTDPNGNTTKYEYYDSTRDGRLKKTINPLTRAVEQDYDANGNILWAKDPKGNIVYTSYDELNRPVRSVDKPYTDTVLGSSVRPVVITRYDTLGRVVEVKAGYTDASGTNPASDVVATQASYSYDDFGRKLSETDPLGNVWQFEYDINNNVRKITDAKGQITQFTWNYGHQLATQTDHNGVVTTYTRNALGQPVSVTGPIATYSYEYDAAHRVSKITDSRGNKSFSYRYSPGGQLNGFTDAEGKRTDFLYDAVGRLSEIWGPNGDQIAYHYDAGGRLLEKWLPNGVSSRYSYNTDNTLKQLVNRRLTSSIISQHDYTYDVLGNRITHTEAINGSTKKLKYVYDQLSRLNEVRTNDSANTLLESYAYDQFGSRIKKTIGTVTQAYVYDAAQQLLETHQDTPTGALLAGFVYDANGNLTKQCDGGTVTRSAGDCTGSTVMSLQYDVLNRTAQISKTGIATENYTYDHEGRRLRKNVGSTGTNYLYNGATLYAEYGASWTSPAAVYTHGGGTDTPLVRSTGVASETRFYHQDGLGSVVGVTDNAGAVKGATRYDSWGNGTVLTGSTPQFGYTGREPDATGLIYYRARYYNPQLGRFTQRDPLGMVDGINQYAYVRSNPLNYVDPNGTTLTSPLSSWLQDISASYAPTGYEGTANLPQVRNLTTSDIWQSTFAGFGNEAANAAVDFANILVMMGDVSGNAELFTSVEPFEPTSNYFASQGETIFNGVSAVSGARALGAVTPMRSVVNIANADSVIAGSASHIFARNRWNGIATVDEVNEAIANSLSRSHGRLVEGDNTMLTVLNGSAVTVRANVANGVLRSVNAIPGPTSRTLGRVIDLRD